MELYAIGREQRSICAANLICLISVILTLVQSAPTKFYGSVSDECDWFGSGLEGMSNMNFGVQPVYLRCREGVVHWQYPRGALRIILRLGQSGKEFRGCLKVLPLSSGATLYREEPRRLKYLYGVAEEAREPSETICFESAGGQVALFLEAQGSHSTLKKDVFQFVYDLEPTKEKGYSECRPCTNRELLYLFCTSDFVVRGFISSLFQNEAIHQTELTVHSSEILRDSVPKVFNHTVIDDNNTYNIGTLYRPLHCGTKVGSGEFLFIGRWRLGMPILSCAPRWTEWEKIKQKAVESESYDCMLN